jgi:hypothetical protein
MGPGVKTSGMRLGNDPRWDSVSFASMTDVKTVHFPLFPAPTESPAVAQQTTVIDGALVVLDTLEQAVTSRFGASSLLGSEYLGRILEIRAMDPGPERSAAANELSNRYWWDEYYWGIPALSRKNVAIGAGVTGAGLLLLFVMRKR